MADFLYFEKNGQTVLINYAHIVAVNYKPNTGVAVSPTGLKKQEVHILGQIILKNKFGDMDIFGLATIETLEFDTVEEAQNFVDTYFGEEEKEASVFEKVFYRFLQVAVIIAIVATLALMVFTVLKLPGTKLF